MLMVFRAHCFIFFLFAAAATGLCSQEYRPEISAASREAQLAIGGFTLPQGLKADVWAAEPLLANPVAFKLDDRGRAFVCETFRQQRSPDPLGNWRECLEGGDPPRGKAIMFGRSDAS